jgi:alkaline phosphatase D
MRVAMKRRAFLRATVASVTGVLAGGCGRADDELEISDGSEWFPQSVASGDPRAQSVILWTRFEHPDVGDDDVELALELFADEELAERVEVEGEARLHVTALAAFDHCVKVRVTGLAPATTYWYRFLRIDPGGASAAASRTGRTRTAPEADADAPVRFAFVSCQDYPGRFYNAYAHLAGAEVDFVIHLGDYIYETTGDEGFQVDTPGRTIELTDAAGALEVARGDGESFFAARSLDNYRQLYRTIRGDAALQLVHERFAVIALWDDHEFSDDCWGANATYLDGREPELDLERRQNANQAWFEYMPVDYVEPEFVYDRATPPPDDIRIWRDFVFGRHLHLVATDLRTRRSDHVVPENAYPGAVVATEADLVALGPLPDFASAYVEDLDGFAGGQYAQVLRDAAAAAGYPVDAIAGAISAAWINRVVADTGAATPPIDEATLATLPRGIAYYDLGKSSLWGRIGSRYLLASEPFAVWAAIAFERSGGASEDAMGAEQQQWFLDTMRASTSTWKVWANEYCLSPLQIDLSGLPVPDAFRRVFDITLDDWNGMANRRDALLRELSDVANVVALTGDIHAFFAATPMVRDDPNRKIVEFVGSSVSSLAFQSLLRAQVESDPTLSMVSGADMLAGAIRDLLLLPSGPNAHLGYADVTSHGWALVELDGAALHATFFAHDEPEVFVEHYADADLDALFTATRFRVLAGTRELEQDFGGTWRRWDAIARQWV